MPAVLVLCGGWCYVGAHFGKALWPVKLCSTAGHRAVSTGTRHTTTRSSWRQVAIRRKIVAGRLSACDKNLYLDKGPYCFVCRQDRPKLPYVCLPKPRTKERTWRNIMRDQPGLDGTLYETSFITLPSFFTASITTYSKMTPGENQECRENDTREGWGAGSSIFDASNDRGVAPTVVFRRSDGQVACIASRSVPMTRRYVRKTMKNTRSSHLVTRAICLVGVAPNVYGAPFTWSQCRASIPRPKQTF